MDAIQSVSSYEKNKKKIIKIDKNEAPQKLEKVNNQNIHIIVGSFSDKKNAQALAKQMNNRGFKNARIIGTNTTGLIRVAVASFYTEEEAQKSILEIKKQLSSVWILNEID